jgi:hypothetical protein
VAAETGWPLDKVTRYAEPLLGERAYVAEQAAAVEISRSRGGATLHESVCVRLDVDPDTEGITWDSYRNPEGRWVVTAFHDGAAIGIWLFDETGRTVHPQDESARALMGGGPTAVPPAANTAPARAGVDEQGAAHTGDDRPGGQPVEPPKDRPRLVSVNSDPMARPADANGPNEAAADASTDTDSATEPAAVLFDGPTAQDTPAPADSPEPAAKRSKRSKGKRGRASVPSWDEILFGASKNED